MLLSSVQLLSALTDCFQENAQVFESAIYNELKEANGMNFLVQRILT